MLKALYVVRHAPRAWYTKLNGFLENLGFKRCPSEHAVYTRKEREKSLIVAVYVDDLLVKGSDVSIIESFMRQINSEFEMSDLGRLSYYPGIEVKQGQDYIELKQSGYALRILEKAGLGACNSTKFPMDPKE